jgi:hypothetical protein
VQVLGRAIHLLVHPASANDTGVTGRAVWFAITATVLVLGWVMATAVPFFDYFSSILGSLQVFRRERRDDKL